MPENICQIKFPQHLCTNFVVQFVLCVLFQMQQQSPNVHLYPRFRGDYFSQETFCRVALTPTHIRNLQYTVKRQGALAFLLFIYILVYSSMGNLDSLKWKVCKHPSQGHQLEMVLPLLLLTPANEVVPAARSHCYLSAVVHK